MTSKQKQLINSLWNGLWNISAISIFIIRINVLEIVLWSMSFYNTQPNQKRKGHDANKVTRKNINSIENYETMTLNQMKETF